MVGNVREVKKALSPAAKFSSRSNSYGSKEMQQRLLNFGGSVPARHEKDIDKDDDFMQFDSLNQQSSENYWGAASGKNYYMGTEDDRAIRTNTVDDLDSLDDNIEDALQE